MKYRIKLIPCTYEVEAESLDHAMIAVASYSGTNRITPAEEYPELAMLADYINITKDKKKVIDKLIKNDEDSIRESALNIKAIYDI